MADQIEDIQSLDRALSRTRTNGGGERLPPSQIARARLESIGGARPGSISDSSSTPSIRGREASTISHASRVVSTDRVLRDFATVVEVEEENKTFITEKELETWHAEDERNDAVLQRLRAWDDWRNAQAYLTPLGRLGIWMVRQVQMQREPVCPSDEELLELVHHYYPRRGDIRVEVFDFGDHRTDRFHVPLSEARKFWTEKPDWVIVRWMHVPLGLGLMHSTVEDLFRHAGAGEMGLEFSNANSPDWGYLECEVLNLRSGAKFRNARDTFVLLRDMKSVTESLNETASEEINDKMIIDDIDWRANHIDAPKGFWELAQADMVWQLSEGVGAGMSPHSGLKPIGRHVDQQILSRHPFYRRSQLVIGAFRCFHRTDGFLLSMAPPMGVNYLDKNYSKYIQKPMESLLDSGHASVIASVYEKWAENGTKDWGKKTVEWFLIYLMTEIACTPHAIRSGNAAPDIALAYHSIVQDLKRKKNDKWERHDAAGLVKDYTSCIDEISSIVVVFQNTMNMLRGLKEDIRIFEQEDTDVPNGGYDGCTSRVDWSIRNLAKQLTRLESMLHEMRNEMDALFQLRSIQQGELAISTDSTGKAVLVFTGVTIIFLPLSFFTSYFGMQLKGVVGTDKTQGYFWAVCGSIGFAIVVATTIYAFRHTIGAAMFKKRPHHLV